MNKDNSIRNFKARVFERMISTITDVLEKYECTDEKVCTINETFSASLKEEIINKMLEIVHEEFGIIDVFNRQEIADYVKDTFLINEMFDA